MKKWMKWGLFLLLLLGVAKAEERNYRFLYAYSPQSSPGKPVAGPMGNTVSPVTKMPAGEKTPARETEWAGGYDNPVWGIHLRFPPGFFINPPLKTRDYGVVFVSPGRRSLLYLSWAETPASLKQIYRTSLQRMRQNPDLKITYRRIAGDWFVISTINRAKGTISYMKGYKEGRKFALYLLLYPEGEKGRYDGLIPTLNRQFGLSGHGRKRQPHRKHRHLSGQRCDAMARACYAECPDDDGGCLERCEARRDRCYSSGRW
jgi:hypothetical protein